MTPVVASSRAESTVNVPASAASRIVSAGSVGASADPPTTDEFQRDWSTASAGLLPGSPPPTVGTEQSTSTRWGPGSTTLASTSWPGALHQRSKFCFVQGGDVGID